METTPQVTEAELDRRAAECERFAGLFSSSHRTPKKKRASRKPEFILRTHSTPEGTR